MKNTYLNRLLMWKSLLQYLAEKDSVWKSSGPFSNAVVKLQKEAIAADGVLDAQLVNVRSITGRRNELFEEAFSKVKSIARSATAFGIAAGNSGLVDGMRLSHAKLHTTRQLIRVKVLQAVLANAGGYVEALAAYGVSPDEWKQAAAAVNAYEAWVIAPHQGIRRRVAIVAGVSDIFHRGHAAIGELDNMIHRYAETDAEFVAGFTAYRRVNNRVGRHKSGEGGDAEAA